MGLPAEPAAGTGPRKVSGPTTLRSVADPGPDGILGVERSVLDRDSVHGLGGNGSRAGRGRALAGRVGGRVPGGYPASAAFAWLTIRRARSTAVRASLSETPSTP